MPSLARLFHSRLTNLKLDPTVLVDRPFMGVLQVGITADKLVAKLTKLLGSPDGEVFNPHNKETRAMASWDSINSDGDTGTIRVYPSGRSKCELVVARTGYAKLSRVSSKVMEKVRYTLPVSMETKSGTKVRYQPKLLKVDWQFMTVPLTVDGEVFGWLRTPVKTKVNHVLVLVGSDNPRHEVHVRFESAQAALNFVVTAF